MAFISRGAASGPGAPSVCVGGGLALGIMGVGEVGNGLSMGGPIQPFKYFSVPPLAQNLVGLIVSAWDDANSDHFPYIPFMWAMGAVQSVQDVESDNWGLASSTLGAGGAQLMGFRGFWSLKAAMGSVEALNEAIASTTIGGGGTQMMGFRGYVVYPSAMVGTSELEAITEDFVHEMVSFDPLYFYAPQMQGVSPDEDQFGFNTAVVTATSAFDQDEGFMLQPLIIHGVDDDAITEDFLNEMFSQDLLYTTPAWFNFMLEEEPFGFQTAVVTVNQPWDGESTPGFISLSAVDDIEPWGYEDAIQDVRDEIVEIFIQSWARAESESEQFGQNAPFLTTNSEPWEQWGQIANPPYPITHQVELDQHGQQTPFITAQPFDETDQMGQTWWARDTDDSWSFNTPEVEGELLLEEEIPMPNKPYPVIQQVEDEQFGQNAPFLTATSEVWELVQWPNQPYPATHQVELDQFGQNAPFLIPFGFDFLLDSSVLSQRALDDVDQFSFQLEISEDLALADEDHFISMQFLVQEEDVFGLQPVFVQADVDVPLQANPVVAEDEVLIFQPTAVVMALDGEQNLAQQFGYWLAPELETSNWGWLPPMTQVAEDDAPYDSRAQGYAIPEQEDEMFNWGFNQTTFPSFDQDEIPVITVQGLFHEEDFGQQVQFIVSDQSMGDFQVLALQLDTQVEEVNTGRPFVDADTAEVLAIGFITMADDDFGFQTQQFVMALDDSPEHFPVSVRVSDDVETFGFNASLPTMDHSLPDEFVREWRLYGEDDVWGLGTIYSDQQDSTQAQIPWAINASVDELTAAPELFGFAEAAIEPTEQRARIQDEELTIRVEQQAFSFGDEVDHLPNPPYPTTYQLELDQIGQQPPFIISQPFAWEEYGVPPNQPWPVLDVTDYNDWIKKINFEILKIYKVSILSVLSTVMLAIAQQQAISLVDTKVEYGVILVQATDTLTISEIEVSPRLAVDHIQHVTS